MPTQNSLNIEVVIGPSATHTFPVASDTLVGRVSTDTLTNKTIGTVLTFDDQLSEPATPPTDKMIVYMADRANRMLLRTKGPSGIDTALQPAFFANSQVMYSPGALAALGTTIGAVFTSAGTISHPAISITAPTILNSMRRTQWQSGTSNTTPGGVFTALSQVWSGNAPGLGGFFFMCRFGMTTNTANNRAFIGLCSRTTGILATNVNPSTVDSHIGILLDTGDTGWWISTRNGTTTTRVQIAPASGPEFLSTMNKTTTDVFDVFIFMPPNGSAVTFQVVNVATGALVVNNFTTSSTLPSNTTFLGIHVAAQAGSSAIAQQLHVNRIYLESDI